MENVARSPADGHALVMGTTGTLTIYPHLYANLGFDPARDLAPISMAFTTDHALIVNPGVRAQTAQEFLALAGAQPGRLTYGSAGSGSSTHMVAELFRLAADIQVLHVPYRGSAPALNDTVAGNRAVHAGPAPIGHRPDPGRPCQGAGRHRPAPRRAAARCADGRRDRPASRGIHELGRGGGLAGTPAPAIARINAVLREAAAQPAVRERMAAAGADAAASTPEELAARMGRENERWARVVRDARITIN